MASFSPSRRAADSRSEHGDRPSHITEQLRLAIDRMQARSAARRFVAYFQPATNTYAPLERLESLYREAVYHPDVVGLIVGTRPDCVPDDVLDLLARLAHDTWVAVEYGLQTIHDRSLRWLRRGHDYAAFLDAFQRTRQRGLHVGAHLIVGIPGEGRDDLLATAGELARLRIDSVKLHNLYIAPDTELARRHARGEVRLPDRDEYVALVVEMLERLHPETVIDRLSADAPPAYLIAPDWCRDKTALRAAIEAELVRRDTWQGRLHAKDANR